MASLECSNFEKLKEELTEMGLYELGMNIKDMSDLMAAIKNSHDSAQQEELLRETRKVQMESCSVDSPTKEVKNGIQRKYKNAPERRMPWNLFPFPEQLSLEQRASVLAAYKEQQTICRYHRAKTSSIFAEWNCVFSIPISKHRGSPEFKSNNIHHTRSGRTVKATPHYVDDDSDSEIFSVTRKCRKKMRKLSNEEIIAKSSLFKDIQTQSHTEASVENYKTITESKNTEKSVVNSLNKMPADLAVSGDTQKSAKLWRSPSPEMSDSGNIAVSQIHRESSTSSADIIFVGNDNENDDKESRLTSRKRAKRLKIESIE